MLPPCSRQEDAMLDDLAFQVTQGSPALVACALAIVTCAALLLGLI